MARVIAVHETGPAETWWAYARSGPESPLAVLGDWETKIAREWDGFVFLSTHESAIPCEGVLANGFLPTDDSVRIEHLGLSVLIHDESLRHLVIAHSCLDIAIGGRTMLEGDGMPFRMFDVMSESPFGRCAGIGPHAHLPAKTYRFTRALTVPPRQGMALRWRMSKQLAERIRENEASGDAAISICAFVKGTERRRVG